LEGLDSGTGELDHLPAGKADQMIVVTLSAGGLESDLAVNVDCFAKQPGVKEMRECSIDCGARHADAAVGQFSVQFFGCKVPLSGGNVPKDLHSLMGGSETFSSEIFAEYPVIHRDPAQLRLNLSIRAGQISVNAVRRKTTALAG